jgi:hypothetical protein
MTNFDPYPAIQLWVVCQRIRRPCFIDNLECVVSLSDNKDEMTEVLKRKLLHWKKTANKIKKKHIIHSKKKPKSVGIKFSVHDAILE